MYNKEIYNIFKNKCRVGCNGSDQFYMNVPSDKRKAARDYFGINYVEEEILALRDTGFWNMGDQGLVITDWGIYCIPDNEDHNQNFSISWESIENIVYKDEMVYFYDKNADLLAQIHQTYFLKSDFTKMNHLVRCFKEIYSSCHVVDAGGIFNEFRSLVADESVGVDVKDEKGNSLISSDIFNDYGKALIYSQLANAWMREYAEACSNDGKYAKKSWKEREEIKKNAIDLITDYAQVAIKISPDEDKPVIKGEAGYYLSWACHQKGDHLTAVRIAIDCLEGATAEDAPFLKDQISAKWDDGKYNRKLAPNAGYGMHGDSLARMREIYEQDYAESLKEAKQSNDQELVDLVESDHTNYLKELESGQRFFSHRPYHDRQFIFVVRDLDRIGGCYDPTDNVKYVFCLDELPGDITFPFGHPQANTLYFAHPLRPHYIPVENANLTLFFEKIQEMGRLLQCLGATEVTFRCLKGHKIDESTAQVLSGNAYAGNRVNNLQGEMSKKKNENLSASTVNEMSETKYYNPARPPYCPDDLVWAARDSDLNAIIKERLEGGLLTFNKKVSSLETMNTSSSQIADVQAAFENFMLKVSAN